MKKLSLLALLTSGCIFVVSEEKPTSQEAPQTPSSEVSTSQGTLKAPPKEAPTSQETKKIVNGDVTFLSVSVVPATGFVDGYELPVKISLEVNTKMSLVAPHIEVSSECKVGTETFIDKEQAFFMSLSEAAPGNQKEDIATLFKVNTLPKKPERCELTLQLTKGEGGPQKYCYQNDTTKEGKCAP
jgi:hypothetical protein